MHQFFNIILRLHWFVFIWHYERIFYTFKGVLKRNKTTHREGLHHRPSATVK